MTDFCENDCATPADFPRSIDNRPGLDHISYRIGTYGDILAAILDGINNEPILQNWTHRSPDDPGIALLEASAVVGEILTFYQELYANEAYLRTARWRESISDLVRLLGYRLAPGLGGRATFAFTLRGDKPVMIPAGFPLKAQVTGLEQQADFETSIETEAVPGLGKFNLYRPFKYPQLSNAVNVLTVPTAELQAAGLKLEPKDRLMLLDSDTTATTNHQIVIIKKVETHFDLSHITIEGSYSGGAGRNTVRAYKLGKTHRHFGHNAPPQVIKISGTTVTQENVSYYRSASGVTGSATIPIIAPSFTDVEIPLDKEVDGLAVGATVLLQGPNSTNQVVARRITAFRNASMTWGALSGGTTIISVDRAWDALINYGAGSTFSIYYFILQSLTDIRKVSVHETAGRGLTLRPVPIADPAADNTSLMFYGSATDYQKLKGRRLALLKADGKMLETVANLPNLNPNRESQNVLAFRRIYLSPPVANGFSLDDFPFENPPVTVYGNLADATQGKTERVEVLGNGDARQSFQSFKLPKAPLTYLNHVETTPPHVPELSVYVENRLWQQVDSLFGHGPTESIYIVREDLQGNSWVQFGDGITGLRLPSGIDNVTVKFRTSLGAFGTLKPETTVQAGAKLDHLDKVSLPGIVTGGEVPESGDNARLAAPGKVQSLGRLVSLQDFEYEALAIVGVSKVKASWSLIDNIPGVVVTVLMETGRAQEIEQVRQILAAYNRCRGPQRYPIHVVEGRRMYTRVSADVAFDPTYQVELVSHDIQLALGVTFPLAVGQSPDSLPPSKGLFSIGQRAFGESEYATRLAGVIQNVPGVKWTRIRQLYALGEADDAASLSPLGLRFTINRGVLRCDNRHLLSLYISHLQLNAVSLPATEVC